MPVIRMSGKFVCGLVEFWWSQGYTRYGSPKERFVRQAERGVGSKLMQGGQGPGRGIYALRRIVAVLVVLLLLALVGFWAWQNLFRPENRVPKHQRLPTWVAPRLPKNLLQKKALLAAQKRSSSQKKVPANDLRAALGSARKAALLEARAPLTWRLPRFHGFPPRKLCYLRLLLVPVSAPRLRRFPRLRRLPVLHRFPMSSLPPTPRRRRWFNRSPWRSRSLF